MNPPGALPPATLTQETEQGLRFRVLKRSDYLQAKWKNGLGVTEQIGIYPDDSDLKRADFLWRLSTARIEKDSAFSSFPHHDRILILLEGNGIALSHSLGEAGEDASSAEEAWERVELSPLEPYEFPGDILSRCHLTDGPVRDFSIFLRKGAVQAEVQIVSLEKDQSHHLQCQASVTFVFAASGRFRLTSVKDSNGDQGELSSREWGPFEALRLDAPRDWAQDEALPLEIQAREGGKLIVVELLLTE